jgi:hypothetical protein
MAESLVRLTFVFHSELLAFYFLLTQLPAAALTAGPDGSGCIDY